MEVEFDDRALRALYTDPTARSSYADGLVRRYRFVMLLIANAVDERDLRVLPGLRFEKLKGKRAHQHSFRLNDQWRLVVEIRGDGTRKRIGVVEIADYH